MKEIKDLREVLKELHAVDSCASGTDRFMAKCFPLMIKQNIATQKLLEKVLHKKARKYKKSQWQHLLSVKLKLGYTIKECANIYRGLNPDGSEKQ